MKHITRTASKNTKASTAAHTHQPNTNTSSKKADSLVAKKDNNNQLVLRSEFPFDTQINISY